MEVKSQISFEHLGQSGLLLKYNNIQILVDPYLSNSVEKFDGPDLQRQVPIPYLPSELSNINYVFITHDHLDHCDPETIPIIAKASPQSIFVGPQPVRKLLKEWNIPSYRIINPPKSLVNLCEGLSFQSTLAAHPTLKFDDDGDSIAVGWLLQLNNLKVYIAGDTSLCKEIINTMKRETPIDIAILPVNEDNYYRRERGIIGNMSIREAFQFALDIGAKTVIPVHWDLFEINSVSPNEILAVYKSSKKWSFKLIMNISKLRI